MEIDQQKEKIILFTREQFILFGYNKVTLDELASKLGMSKKTFYKYFKDKEDLLRWCVHYTMDTIHQGLTSVMAEPISVVQKLNNILKFMQQNMQYLSAISQPRTNQLTPELWGEIESFRKDKILRTFGLLFRQGKDENVFRSNINDTVMILSYLAAIQAILNPEVLGQASFSAEEAMHTIVRIFFHGAMTDEAREKFQFDF